MADLRHMLTEGAVAKIEAIIAASTEPLSFAEAVSRAIEAAPKDFGCHAQSMDEWEEDPDAIKASDRASRVVSQALR